jgi:hypothetical protein
MARIYRNVSTALVRRLRLQRIKSLVGSLEIVVIGAALIVGQMRDHY